MFFFVSLFSGHLFIDYWLEFSTFGTSKSRFSPGMYCKHWFFTEIVFYELRHRSLPFFGGLGGQFSSFLSLEDRLENGLIFVMYMDPEKLTGGADQVPI